MSDFKSDVSLWAFDFGLEVYTGKLHSGVDFQKDINTFKVPGAHFRFAIGHIGETSDLKSDV